MGIENLMWTVFFLITEIISHLFVNIIFKLNKRSYLCIFNDVFWFEFQMF